MTDAARTVPGGRTATGGEQPKQKPSTLLYTAGEKVPASIGFLNAVQHIAAMLPVLVFPLLGRPGGRLGRPWWVGFGAGRAAPAKLGGGSALGFGTLGLMIALQVWARGMMRMLSVFLAMICGSLFSLVTGVAAHHPLAEAASTVLFG